MTAEAPRDGELATLAASHGLGSGQRRQLATLLAVVGEDSRAPTAIRDRDRALREHLADSLVALELEVIRAAGTMADMGSGAGFPGAALAVALPASQVSLVEATARKADFLRRLAARADLANVKVVNTRLELWEEGVSGTDAVLARALGPQAVVLEYAAPLLRVGGTLVEWRGRRARDDEAQGQRAAAVLGLELEAVVAVTPFEGARERHLHVFRKVVETDRRFPRRPGMASKRPLGAARG
jgi:16S rRNA (guanine527-N7)-methyltransferase